MKRPRRVVDLLALLLAAQLAFAQERVLVVTATAYNSTRAQTDSRPNTGAWGDRLEPGMKVIAVSPDLVGKGLKRGAKVRIDELEGEWIVLDRTPSRLRNHIDIYMGVDIRAARKWGRRKVTVRW
jgi:3D (Asp-Asp-Asp) domain-containing protein